MRSSACVWLLSGALLAGLLVAWKFTLMLGFWTWFDITLFLLLIWAGRNHQKVSKALEMNPLKITSWVMFILLSLGFFLLYANFFILPDIASIELAVLSTGFAWWGYYALEPAKA